MPQNNTARATAIVTLVLCFILAVLGMFGSALHGTVAQAAAPPQVAPTASLIVVFPTPAPTHLVVAYAAPDGDVLGPMDLGQESVAPVGRKGSSWAQVQRGDGSRVWIRAGELTPALQSVALQQPDVSPPVAVMSVPMQVAPAVAEWQHVVIPAPLAETTAPPPVIDAALNDPAQNGGNVAPIGCPFPIINGVCANGVLARDVPDEYAEADLQKQQDYLDSERRSAVAPHPAPVGPNHP